jgi:hypothetical protein
MPHIMERLDAFLSSPRAVAAAATFCNIGKATAADFYSRHGSFVMLPATLALV